VKSTGQIGIILVRRCTKVRQDWRVEFACGGRAERLARHDFQLLRQAAEQLGCAPEDAVSALGRALAERDANFKALRAAQERLAEAEATLALHAATPGTNGFRVVSRVFEGISPDYLGFFATALTRSEKAIALLAAADGGHLLFAQHPNAGRDMNAALKQVLEKMGGKGGGTRDFARGKLSDSAKARQALEAAVSLI
jgi:alanyl-tRNA synthetase